MNTLPTTTEAFEEDDAWRPSAALNPKRIQFLWGLATRMAASGLVPESLRTRKEGNDKVDLGREEIVANVFAVVEQADRWDVSPFALLSCAAIVHGKLGFEGKVIAAVLETRYGVRLSYVWSGTGEQMRVRVTGVDTATGEPLVHPATGEELFVEGSVAEWKTTGNNSPWKPNNYPKMLAYRGSREFARIHKPAAIMGVNSIDEIMEFELERRAQVATETRPRLSERFRGQKPAEGGFNAGSVTNQIADMRGQQTELRPGVDFDRATGELVETSPQPTADAQASSANVGGGHVNGQGEKPTSESGLSGAGQEAAPAPRLDAAVFDAYHKALARFDDRTKLSKAATEFWQANGGWPPANARDLGLGKKIFDTHGLRVEGKISPADAAAHIAEAIAEEFGGGL